MDRLDGYLSRKAQLVDQTALIYELENGNWILRVAERQDLKIGDNFNTAKQAIDALIRAKRAREWK